MAFGCFGVKSKRSQVLKHENGEQYDEAWHVSHFDEPVRIPRTPRMQELRESSVAVGGYSVKGKSAEILGLAPKSASLSPPASRSSLSPTLVVHSHGQTTSYSTDTDSIISSIMHKKQENGRRKHTSIPIRPQNSVRSKTSSLQKEMMIEPEPKSREVIKHKIISTPIGNKTMFDDASTFQLPQNESILEADEIIDLDKLSRTNDDASMRIRSAALTTFTWMKLQEDSGNTDHRTSRRLQNLSDASSVFPIQSIRSRKGSTTQDDRRNTMQWMGLEPKDFPDPPVHAISIG